MTADATGSLSAPDNVDELAEKYSSAVLRYTEARNKLELFTHRRHIVKAAEKEIARDNAAASGQKVTEARLEDMVNCCEAMAELLKEEEQIREEFAEAAAEKSYYGVFCRIMSDEQVE